LFITNVSVIAPALLKAFAVSYSQFVPGNTGIITLGLGTETFGFTIEVALNSIFTLSCLSLTLIGYTSSNVFSHDFIAFFSFIVRLSYQ